MNTSLASVDAAIHSSPAWTPTPICHHGMRASTFSICVVNAAVTARVSDGDARGLARPLLQHRAGLEARDQCVARRVAVVHDDVPQPLRVDEEAGAAMQRDARF